MKKRAISGGVFAALFLLAAAYGAAEQAQDTWTIIKSPGEITGVWRGRAESRIPADALAPNVPGIVLDYIMVAAYEAGAESVAMELFVGVSSLLDALLKVLPEEAGPMTKESLWLRIVEEVGAESGAESTEDYYIKFSQKQPVEEFIASGENGQMLINQGGTKMRWVSPEPITLGLGDDGFKEMLFIRQ
jgi:hypothetical protein